MELDGGQFEVLGDVGVFDGKAFVDRFALHPLRRQRAGSDGGAAPEGLELGIYHLAALIHLVEKGAEGSEGGDTRRKKKGKEQERTLN